MDELRFDGEVVVVTGGAGGIGRSQALGFARRGARVVVNDLGGTPRGIGADAALAESVAAEIRASGGEAIANCDNVAAPEGGRRIVDAALETWGRVDAVVTNAGILRDHHFEDMTIEDWDDVVSVNLRGTFCVAQPAFIAMKAQGGGRIVTVASASGLCGGFGQSNYSSSKMGIVGLTRSIAHEGRQHGIMANVLAPGAIDTRMAATFTPDDPARVGRPPDLHFDLDSSFPAELLRSDRVTPMVLALAHKACSVTGEIYGAHGGWYNRFWVSYSDGWFAGPEQPTPEDVVAHLEEIRSPDGAGREIAQEVHMWTAEVFAEKLRLAPR